MIVEQKGEVKGALEVKATSGTWRVKKTATKEDSLTWTHTITSIDAKDGVKITKTGTDTDVFEKKSEKKPDDKKPVGFEPGVLIGGLATGLAVCLGGLWLVRRRK